MSPEEPGIAALTRLKARATCLSDQLWNGPPEEKRRLLHATIQRIDLTPTSIVLILHKPALTRLFDLPNCDDQGSASMSPRIVEDIFKGRQAADVTVHRLRRLSSLPFAWQEQAERLENLG